MGGEINPEGVVQQEKACKKVLKAVWGQKVLFVYKPIF